MSVTISAKEVNELRQKTGSGMMDCKKALVESGGDFDKAIDILRKKGQKVSEARSGRETSEGIVLYKLSSSEDKASMLSFTCETDFVAKNEEFVDLGNQILDHSFSNNLSNIEDVLNADIDGLSVAQHITNLVGKIGEKIVNHYPRKYGKTKFGIERFINGFLDLISVSFVYKFKKKPMHFFGTMGVFSFLFGKTLSIKLSKQNFFISISF